MELTQKVTEIIEKAAEIEKLNLWEQGKAAKALLKDDVVPVLLEMAQFIDGVKSHLLTVTELQKQAFLEIQQVANSQQSEIAELKKQIAALKKPAPKKPLSAVTA